MCTHSFGCSPTNPHLVKWETFIVTNQEESIFLYEHLSFSDMYQIGYTHHNIKQEDSIVFLYNRRQNESSVFNLAD